jgi:ATP-binding cassette, subfamily B, bacterial
VTARPPTTLELFAERWRLLSLLQLAPGPAVVLAGCLLLVAVTPSVLALVLGWLVSGIESIDREVEWGELALPLASVSVTFLLEETFYALSIVARTAAGSRIDRLLRRELRSLSLRRLSASQLDDPAIVDDLARISDLDQKWVRSVGAAATGQLLLLFRFAGGGFATILLSVVLSPLLAMPLLVVCLCNRALLRRQWMGLHAERDARERFLRRADYWTGLGRSPEAAKDLRMFGLSEWLVARRTAAFLEYVAPLRPGRRRVTAGQWPIVLMTATAGCLVLLVPTLALRAGTIDASELVTCFYAGWGILGILFMGYEAFDIEYGSGSLRALERLRAAAPKPEPVAAEPVRFDAVVRCEGVAFAYPGTDRPVISGLDLDINAGEVIGLVGRNGVGKTTLIRLLTGLYRPDAGCITVDGADLAGLPDAAWHRRVSVVFQDFGRFPASVADNIAIGAVEHAADREGILEAARTAGIDRWLDDLRDGIDTLLGREFENGADLSGGQWQGIAIARGLFAARHGRDLLIFDEPTAHLDAHAEAAFFDRVTSAIDGAAIVLISHRLGTIRHADRIVMLGPEGIIEQGRHERLMASGGEYARLFSLQASQFADLEPGPGLEPGADSDPRKATA